MKKLLTMTVLSMALISTAALADHHGGKHKMGGKKGKMIEHMFNKNDTDGDGAISKAEFMAEAEERFVKMDGDGDGKITKAEAEAFGEQMRQKWKEKREMKKEGFGQGGGAAE